MPQQYLLSIDQGTTGTTAAIISTKGQMKAKVNQEFRQIFPHPGWVEHNPDDIWKSVVKAISLVLEKAKIKPRQILAIGITNQRETVVAWDRVTGKTLSNAIVWQCRRTTSFCQELKKQGYEKDLRKVTGLVLDPYFSGTKMNWLLRNHSGVQKSAGQGQLCFGTMDSFLMWKLSGGEIHSTDVSNASRTQLMSLKTLDYNEDMLNIMEVERDMLPQIHSSGGVFGVTKKMGPLPSGIPIAGVLGDQQSALFGQFAHQPGDSKITYGTGSFLLMNTGEKSVKSPSGLLSTVAWQLPHQQTASYALEGGAFICGAAVQWLRDNLKIIKNSKDIEVLAKKAQTSNEVQFVPAFAGLGAPYWDPEVRGGFLGLTRGTNNGHLAYATLESMALQNVDLFSAMAKDSKMKLKSIKADGGAAANNLLLQMQADFMGAQLKRPKVLETTALGAALMAGLGVGVWSDLKELKKLESLDQIFKPQMPSSQRRSRLDKWQGALKALQVYAKSI